MIGKYRSSKYKYLKSLESAIFYLYSVVKIVACIPYPASLQQAAVAMSCTCLSSATLECVSLTVNVTCTFFYLYKYSNALITLLIN